MGSASNSTKHHYDLTMSKRTRRPMNLEGTCQQNVAANSPERESASEVIAAEVDKELVKVGAVDHMSQNELTENPKNDEEEADGCQESQGSSNPIEHQHRLAKEEEQEAEEEKHLQMVTVQRGEGAKGVKLGRMMRRYMKVFSHLIKANKESHLGRKNHVLQLTM